MNLNCYKTIVIGAGPAGLAYASTIKEQESLLVIDLGKPLELRHKQNPEECVSGAGGAGLFSDGKFSFYPSGTKIWEYDHHHLKIAYAMLTQDLAPYKRIPSFPKIGSTDKREKDLGNWLFKPYKSIYLSYEDRTALIQNLVQRCLHIRYQTEFLKFAKEGNGYNIELKNLKTDVIETIFAENIVCAGGRFMPQFLDCPKQFRRYEFGFRVEAPSHMLPKKSNFVDPKHILACEDQNVEFRTFCWCEQGEIVQTKFKDIITYSGRADCPPTNKNNFGFNIRIGEKRLITNELFKQLVQTSLYKEKIVEESKVLDHFPCSLHKIISIGLSRLKERFPALNNEEVYVFGPTVEGVGEYPSVDTDSCINNQPGLYAIGDCNGTYRGIVASMLSGYFLASKHNTKEEHN